MTPTQRADRDFWLEAAERAFMALRNGASNVYLCCEAQPLGGDAGTGLRRKARLDLFRNPQKDGVWWATNDGDWPDIYGPASGRVLAACFLAAMCESGDV